MFIHFFFFLENSIDIDIADGSVNGRLVRPKKINREMIHNDREILFIQ
jgi:hypothetical protein